MVLYSGRQDVDINGDLDSTGHKCRRPLSVCVRPAMSNWLGFIYLLYVLCNIRLGAGVILILTNKDH